MDDNDKHGVCGEIGLQSPDATNVIIQPTESDINPNSVPSMVSAHSGISADIPAYCTDNYKIRQNIKYEHEPLETTQTCHLVYMIETPRCVLLLRKRGVWQTPQR